MRINRNKFKTLLLLYAANIDGQVHPDEVKVILKNMDSKNFEKLMMEFGKMSDLEILECIRENKDKYAATPADRLKLLEELRTVIAADDKCTSMEEFLYRNIDKLLKQE